MGRLTTHVLDAAHGCPGNHIKVELYRVQGAQLELVATATTNSDGRCDAPLLQGDNYVSGVYQLQFNAGDYYRVPRRGGAALRYQCRTGPLPRATADFALQLLHLSR
jgi:5-hydroxyisourate hydrolase-like protein (transthyretin family)